MVQLSRSNLAIRDPRSEAYTNDNCVNCITSWGKYYKRMLVLRNLSIEIENKCVEGMRKREMWKEQINKTSQNWKIFDLENFYQGWMKMLIWD
jgi:hypothetical protein